MWNYQNEKKAAVVLDALYILHLRIMLRSRTRFYHEVNWTLCYYDLNQKPGSRLNKKNRVTV